MPVTIEKPCFAVSYGAYQNADYAPNSDLSPRLQKIQVASQSIAPRIVLFTADAGLRSNLETYLKESGFEPSLSHHAEKAKSYRKGVDGLMINLAPASVASFVSDLSEKLGAILIDRRAYVSDLMSGNDPSTREGTTAEQVAQDATLEVEETKVAVKARR